MLEDGKKIIMILPYYGQFNSYFSLWLRSCSHNRRINWLLVTDNLIHETIPENVRIKRMSFAELRSSFEKRIGFSLNLFVPYKLCDYKPYYGFFFDQDIKGYDYWGYCDCDTIWGDLLKFIPQQILNEYDRIFRHGHFSIVRNTEAINTNFMKFDTYKTVMRSPAIYGYDESIDGYHLGFAGELLEKGYRFYRDDSISDNIDFRHFPFGVVNSPISNVIYYYDNGKLFRLSYNDGQVIRSEAMYIHLQKRKMANNKVINSDKYLIYPNTFDNYSDKLLKDTLFWETVSTERPRYYSKSRELIRRLKRDIIRLRYEKDVVDSIKYRLGIGK